MITVRVSPRPDLTGAVFTVREIPMNDLIIYEAHVPVSTRDPSSNVSNPGTFDGLMEKIPYLKELGVNAVELMPIFEFDEMNAMRVHDGNLLLDYWGYNPVCFFAPNTAYSAHKEFTNVGDELRRLIRQLHRNNMEVILDVVFNHTAEGNEDGSIFSLKGVDNICIICSLPMDRITTSADAAIL